MFLALPFNMGMLCRYVNGYCAITGALGICGTCWPIILLSVRKEKQSKASFLGCFPILQCECLALH